MARGKVGGGGRICLGPWGLCNALDLAALGGSVLLRQRLGEVLAEPELADRAVDLADVLVDVAVGVPFGAAVEVPEAAEKLAVGRRVVNVGLGVGVERAVS